MKVQMSSEFLTEFEKLKFAIALLDSVYCQGIYPFDPQGHMTFDVDPQVGAYMKMLPVVLCQKSGLEPAPHKVEKILHSLGIDQNRLPAIGSNLN